MVMVTREPTQAPSVPLGRVVISNPTARRRRLMVHTVIPCAQIDGVANGDPITVLQPGTGRNELADVTHNWLVPYGNGSQKGVRVLFPAVINAGDNDMRVDVLRSNAGQTGAFRLRGNVQQGIEAVGIRFTCGPLATHHVMLKDAGALLPNPIRSGTHSRTYVWQARVYEPAHAPTLRTEMLARLEVEIFDDQDYAEFRFKFVNSDPRVTDPDGMSRAGWTDDETEIALEFIVPNQNLCQPVPWSPEQCVVSNTYTGDRWRWVLDRRLVYGGQSMNEVLPYGCRAPAEGVLLFRGTSGDLGDQLRNDSVQAWIDWPDPVYGISDQHLSKPEAWVVPHLPRPFKRHEHFDQNRDYAYVRDRFRTQVRNLQRTTANAGRAYLWDRGPAVVNWCQTQYGVDSTGYDDGWTKLPLWPGIAYLVPDEGAMARRWIHAVGSPVEFLAADGTKITPLTHPNLQMEVGSPGQRLGNGDLLGKSRLQTWRTQPNGFLLRSPVTIGSSVGPNINGKDRAHFECGAPFAHCAIYGSWAMRDLCETIAYTRVMGEWSAASWNVGVLDQPRGLARGVTMHGWASWLFGADTAWRTQINNLRTVRIDPGHQAVQTNYGLVPKDQRGYKTATIQQRNTYPGPTRVNLRLYEYGRWWEDANGILGLVSLAHHMAPTDASLAWLTTMRDEYMETHKFSCPRGVDANGRVLWTVLRPNADNQPATVYEPAAAVAVIAPGSQWLTEQMWQQNNWTLCDNLQGGQCSVAEDGFARLGTPNNGTATFCSPPNAWLWNGRGAESNPRHVRFAFDQAVGRTDRPNSIPIDTVLWLTNHSLRQVFTEWLHVNNQTSRVAIGATPSGIAMASNGQLLITRAGQTNVLRQTLTGGSSTVQPAAAYEWSGIAAHGSTVALLDGLDATNSRTSYRMLITDESFAGGQEVVITLPQSRELRGLAWDPISGTYLTTARMPTGAVVYRISPSGGMATLDTSISLHEDFDTQPQSITVSQDGKLLAVGRSDGVVWLHTRAMGGYWSHPRLRVVRGGWVTFTRYQREDDLLRLVSIAEGSGQIVESEV